MNIPSFDKSEVMPSVEAAQSGGFLDAQLRSLLSENPLRACIMRRFGLGFACGLTESLRRCCDAQCVPPEEVARAFRSAPVGLPTGDDKQQARLILRSTVNHIQSVHHSYLRQQLPQLLRSLEKICKHHGRKFPQLYQVKGAFHSYADDVLMHLVNEESILLPHLAEYSTPSHPGSSSCRSLLTLHGVMESQDQESFDDYKQIRTLAQGIQLHGHEALDYLNWLANLRNLESDIECHCTEENVLVWPMLRICSEYVLDGGDEPQPVVQPIAPAPFAEPVFPQSVHHAESRYCMVRIDWLIAALAALVIMFSILVSVFPTADAEQISGPVFQKCGMVYSLVEVVNRTWHRNRPDRPYDFWLKH